MPRDGAIIFGDLIGKLDVLGSSAPSAGARAGTDSQICCMQGDQFFGQDLRLIWASRREAVVNSDAAALFPAVALKCLPESGEAGLYLRVVLVVPDKHSDSTGRLLRPRHQRPRRRTAEER
jgi:hypothetical protein